VIPKAVNKHEECDDATAKQNFQMTGHAFQFSHTRNVKPPHIFCREKHGAIAATNRTSYGMQYSRSHNALIRVYGAAGNVIETYQHKGDFKEF